MHWPLSWWGASSGAQGLAQGLGWRPWLLLPAPEGLQVLPVLPGQEQEQEQERSRRGGRSSLRGQRFRRVHGGYARGVVVRCSDRGSTRGS